MTEQQASIIIRTVNGQRTWDTGNGPKDSLWEALADLGIPVSDVITTSQQAAELLGVNTSRVRQIEREGRLSKLAVGVYDTADVLAEARRKALYGGAA